MPGLRRFAATAAIGIAVAGLLVPTDAAADPPTTQTCAGSVPDFCLTGGLALTTPGTSTTETRANAPVDLAMVLSDTSPAHTAASEKSRWLQSVGLHLVTSGDTSPQVTPSAQLPSGLLVAGSAAGCGPGADASFSTCTAGRGTALVDVSGTLNTFDGVHSATFGISRIYNIKSTGALAEYHIDVTFCIANAPAGNCAQPVNQTLTATIPSGPGDQPLTLVAAGQTDVAISPFTVHLDYSLDSLALAVLGNSDTLQDGSPAGGTFAVIRLGAGCGAASASAAATSRGGQTEASTVALTTTDCPTAGPVSVTGTAPTAAHLSTSGTGVGRAVTSYRWTFGDGTSATTTTPAADHTYPSSDPRTGTVVAVDALGLGRRRWASASRQAAVGCTARRRRSAGGRRG